MDIRNFKLPTPPISMAFAGLLGASIISPAYGANLVSVAELETWEKGMVHNFWCSVSTPSRYQVSSHGTALLEWIKPQGSFVREGEVLAKQHTFYLEREVKTLELELAAAKITQEYEQRELRRLKKLSMEVLSEFDLQEQENKFKLAELNVKQLQQKLEASRYQLAHFEHKAPVSGVIVEMHVEPGQSITQGQLMATIEPSEQRELKCQLPVDKYRAFSGVAGLMNATYRTKDNQSLHYLRGNHIANKEAQVINFILGYEANPGQDSLVGERVSVELSQHRAGLASIPYDALEITNNGYFVWYLRGDQTVDRQSVDVLFNVQDKAIVRTKLAPGNQVITTGKRGLTVGDKVKVEQSNSLMAQQNLEDGYES
ncbi:efflux RND transporter periplasmic adaptor subunit [Pseudoalteromonas viridis]|uniref:Efflux RND transporter periplasmic adaptor subunit n=1 Tax=Pseudoalteromonas viridis TaxID=339617 RepID=A0ABX7VB84_9GAMM|nr:efflux RND transporter periplasmic adaptor subunit [Pseudoalteromonas viridis]QTL36455.1 efflux RND transporter periplasmic adaptor subunit [Pseudoalteromonas viridis]